MEAEHDVITKTKIDESLDNPKQYKVIMYNDNFTTMDFVVFVLENIFGKNKEEAESIMLKIHNSGKAIVGIYSKEIAETKIDNCSRTAKYYQQPLLCEIAPE